MGMEKYEQEGKKTELEWGGRKGERGEEKQGNRDRRGMEETRGEGKRVERGDGWQRVTLSPDIVPIQQSAFFRTLAVPRKLTGLRTSLLFLGGWNTMVAWSSL